MAVRRRHVFVTAVSLIMCFSISGYYFIGLQNDSNFDEEQIVGTRHDKMPKWASGKKLNFDTVYEPREIGKLEQISTTKSNESKMILMWTPWNGLFNTVNYYALRQGRESFVKFGCPVQDCFVTNDRSKLDEADAVLFYLLDIYRSGSISPKIPETRPPNQVWILYIMEAPWQVEIDLKPLRGIFNWTMSYRSDSDILARYGFVGPREHPINENDFKLPSVNQKSKWVAWFVSDCHVPSKREEYVKELSKHIEVDIYGSCGTLNCYPSQSHECYANVLKKYKYYLSFENSICKDYVTEKFFNILDYDIIPVVFGGAEYANITPGGSYIDAGLFQDPKDLATLLTKIGSEQEYYESFFQWKRTHKPYLDPWTCRLCSKLHEKTQEPKTLPDVDTWWMKNAECRTWKQFHGFVKEGTNNETVF